MQMVLSEKDIRKIRKVYKNGGKASLIAQFYNISVSTVRNIVNHKGIYKLQEEKMENKSLKMLRVGKGIKQREMAKMLGMTEQNYRNYELGSYREMSIELEKKISDILGVSYKYSEEV